MGLDESLLRPAGLIYGFVNQLIKVKKLINLPITHRQGDNMVTKSRISHSRSTIYVHCNHWPTTNEEEKYGDDRILPNDKISHPHKGRVRKDESDHDMTMPHSISTDRLGGHERTSWNID